MGYELKIENNKVKIHTCTQGGNCTGTTQEFDMGAHAATSCMAKIQMDASGAGYTVVEAVTLDITTTLPDDTTTAAPTAGGASGTNGTTGTNGTNNETATTAAPAEQRQRQRQVELQ